MKDYLDKDAWKIVESRFHPEHNKITESIFSIGNGYMGHRANFEECYSGESMQGSYLAGVYYPDKTRVGWWKNGYPEYFAKVINSVNWIGIDLLIEGEKIDLQKAEIIDFERCLDMQKGLLSRRVEFRTSAGHQFILEAERFCSWETKELGLVQYSVKSVNYKGELVLTAYLDFDVHNQDSNYDEQFWAAEKENTAEQYLSVSAHTKKTMFYANASMHVETSGATPYSTEKEERNMFVSQKFLFSITPSDSADLTKYVAICSSLNVDKDKLETACSEILDKSISEGYTSLRHKQIQAWKQIWEQGDIVINGDVAAQQGIRFNIFHLYQTYSGHDSRLNIGPKGFTGEKYGGVTYWDTEAYCLPFYLGTASSEIAFNLLMYRYNQLDKAIENAAKLGFTKGAALYPMVTMTGEECHNEWEITFEEIHRNGAIAYAIHDYTRYTGDRSYLLEYGIEVLIAISRFWAQRVNWSNDKEQYVMLGVTGPNEYENNVNNNWYTNYIACWCLRFTMETIQELKSRYSAAYTSLVDKIQFDEEEELAKWKDINSKMYYPFDQERQVFLQQDGFLDKELVPASSLPEEEVPIHQNWSWDRILRSCFIKQADVLQGLDFFEDQFDLDTIRRNFDFYEPMTVHESSLSPCVHTILAAKLDYKQKAYEMYLRTARLDLDDYNNDTKDGLHITSMGGTWMSIIKGFGGMTIKDGKLSFAPFLPEQWDSYKFCLRYRENILSIKVDSAGTTIENLKGPELSLFLNNKLTTVNAAELISLT